MKLTKRGKRVKALGISLLIGPGIYLILLIDSHLWLTPHGYCWGSMAKCLVGGL